MAVTALLWAVVFVLLCCIVFLVGCGAALPPDASAPTSRAAFANPNCVHRCYVAVSSVDDNATKGNLTTTESRAGSVTETQN